jgi:hypothetical protein
MFLISLSASRHSSRCKAGAAYLVQGVPAAKAAAPRLSSACEKQATPLAAEEEDRSDMGRASHHDGFNLA